MSATIEAVTQNKNDIPWNKHVRQKQKPGDWAVSGIINVLLLLLGCVREWMALGTVFGTPVGQRAVLPMAGMPAGGFIVLGVLCAVWRALAARRKAYLVREARSLVDVHAQKEADGEQ